MSINFEMKLYVLSYIVSDFIKRKQGIRSKIKIWSEMGELKEIISSKDMWNILTIVKKVNECHFF